MPLFLDTGVSTRTMRSEDGAPCLVVVPDGEEENPHGALLALGGGVAERPEPDAAAHAAVKTLGDSYYAGPRNWKPEQAMAESFLAANHEVHTGGGRSRAAALSALVLRHRRWTLGHVGDSRIWRFRDRELKLLTRDQVEPRVGQRARISQACGMDESLNVDIASGELNTGDIYVITGDGVHNVLDSTMIMSCLVADIPASQMAECLTNRAVAAGGHHNVSACVVRVETLPAETDADIAEGLAALPVVPPSEIGDSLDGFRFDALLHKSHAYRLYQATDIETGGVVVIKLPNPKLARDSSYAEAFLREEWIGKRVNSAHLLRVLPLRNGRRTALYSVMAYHEGENLAERIRRKGGLSIKESVFLAKQLLEGLDDLHRYGVIHRDVRPKNILFDRKNKHLMLLGLGASRVEPLGQPQDELQTASAGTSYLAPECFRGKPMDARADVYAAGVTLYHMLTNRYPYGKIASRNSPPGGQFISPARHKTELPPWLEEALMRACATDPDQRYQSAAEFAEALTEGTRSAASRARNPASPGRGHTLPWEWLFAGAALLALAAYLLLVLPR